jgi:hypothetical protein
LKHKVLVARNAEWQFRANDDPQGHAWTLLDFDAAGWNVGRAGFGFGDGEFATKLENIRARPSSIYLRKEFQIVQADAVTELGLALNYSDGFIAYINGHEVARVNIGRSSGRNAQGVKARTDRGWTYVAFGDAYQHLHDGVNVLAIEAHANVGAMDFFIDPELILED